jgi:hypothetical protein
VTANAAEQAEAVYEAVRALKHLTFPGQCELTDPAESYRIAASLSSAIYAMPQALRQLGDWLADEAAAGRIRVVGGAYAGDSELAVAAIRGRFAYTCRALWEASEAVTTAHNAMADLAADGGIEL